MKRPVVRVCLGQNNTTQITILLVHLISGFAPKAQAELTILIKAMSQLIPQGTCGVIVGDMNIDILNIATGDVLADVGTVGTVGTGWRVLRTGKPTQQSGGELDYALL